MTKRTYYLLMHIILSLLLALAIAIFIKTQWYPSPLLKATGIMPIFIAIIAVQVVLWPLLSLFVYKENKKSLRFDLSTIIILQMTFWVFSLYALAQGRPAWIAYTLERFELVKANEIVITDIDSVNSDFKSPTWTGPQFVGTKLSEDADVRSKHLLEEVLGGISIAQRPEQYVNINVIKDRMLKEQQSLAELSKYNEISKVDKALASYPDAHGYIPLRTQQVDMVVLLDDSGTPLQIVDLRPWE
ncbi:TfpX/TfpZ family type IV pilin accessory protein [uncultured Psychrobacter sp.]|uniref:TfpX/TfpZ family type IV pilin accessory protein n=1 Tax=uncultured Psychrobacter sp. TaxID=259303 RepID=UPI0030DC7BB3